MSQRTTTFTVCDKCNKSDLKDGVEFIEPAFVWRGQFWLRKIADQKRLDLCVNCDEAGCFRCAQCETVHTHEADCEYLLAEMPEYSPAMI